MLGPAFRPLVVLVLALAGACWTAVVVGFASSPSFEPTAVSEDFVLRAGFALVSSGAALAAWIAHRRAGLRPAPDVADPHGVWLGALLFGCVSLGGAALALFAPEILERYFS